VSRRFLLVGLTGGIATGKSTVSDILRGLGDVIVDADLLAREVVAPGQPALAAIVQEFGADVLNADGALDRKRLASVAFADPERRRRLEAITHPAIRDAFAARLTDLEAQGFAGLRLLGRRRLIESGGHKAMDRLVVVITDAPIQHARAVARDGTRQVERRIANQMPLSEKVKLADYVIDNSGDRAATEARTREVHRALLADLETRARR
jgi:dephospho-CoA kinase